MSRCGRRRAPTGCLRRLSPQMKSRVERRDLSLTLVLIGAPAEVGPDVAIAPALQERFMNTTELPALVSRHRKYFRTGATRSAEWRERQLTALWALMTDRA